ncbi:MAG: hypothetical protein K5663_11420 [Clostridiales bacterium]|nr:hypothetical protein [Clostridiales bacterium]
MSVKLGISFDTKQAVKAAGNLQQSVGKLGAAVKTMFRNSSSRAIESDLNRVKAKTEEVKASIKKMTDAKAAKNSAIREQEKQLTQLNSALKEAQRNFDKLSKARDKRGSGVTQNDVSEAGKDIQWTIDKIEEAEGRLKQLKEEAGRNDTSLASAQAELEQLNGEYKELEAASKAAATGTGALKLAVSGLAGVLKGLLGIIGAAVKLIAGAFVAGLKMLLNLFEATARGALKLGSGLGKLMGKSAALEIKGVAKAVSLLQSGLTALSKGGIKAITGAVKGVGKLGDLIKKYVASFTRIFSKVGSMIKYRVVRRLLSSLFTGVKEGFENLAKYSKAAHNALNSISTSSTYLKNSLAAMAAPALQVIANAFYAIANAAAAAMQAISRFFATIAGRSSYIKAKRYAQDYADTINSAGGSGKKSKDLLGFDQINRLSDQSGSGGAAAAVENMENFFETVKLEGGMQNLYQLGANLAKTINNALNNINWAKIKAKAKQIAENIRDWINGFLSDPELPKTIGKTLGEALNTAADFAITLFYGVNWEQLGENIAEAVNSFFETIDPEKLARMLMGKLQVMIVWLWGFVQKLNWSLIADKLGKGLETAISTFFDTGKDGKSLADKLAGIISGFINGAVTLAAGLVNVSGIDSVGEKLNKALINAFTGEKQTKAFATGKNERGSQNKAFAQADLTFVGQSLTGGIDTVKLGKTLADLVLVAVKNIAGFLTIPQTDMQAVADKISGFINGALGTLSSEDFTEAIGKIGKIITNGLGTLTLAAKGINTEKLALTIGGFITKAINGAGKYILGLWRLASTIWNKVSTAVKSWWKTGGEKKFTAALSGLGTTLGQILNEVTGTLNTFFNDQEKWQSYGGALKQGLLSALKTVDAESLAGALTGMITAGVNLLYGALKDGALLEEAAKKAPDLVSGIIDKLFHDTDEDGMTVAKKAGRIASMLAVGLAKILNNVFSSDATNGLGTDLKEVLVDMVEQMSDDDVAEIGTAIGNTIAWIFDTATKALSFTPEQQQMIGGRIGKMLSSCFSAISGSEALKVDENGQTGLGKAISGVLGTLQIAWESTDKEAFQGMLNTLIGGALNGIVAAASDFVKLGSSVCEAAGKAIKTWWDEKGGKDSVWKIIKGLFNALWQTPIPAIGLTFAGFKVAKGVLKLMLLKAIAGGLGLAEGAAAGASLTGMLSTGLTLTLAVAGTVFLVNRLNAYKENPSKALGEDTANALNKGVQVGAAVMGAVQDIVGEDSSFGQEIEAKKGSAAELAEITGQILENPEMQEAVGGAIINEAIGALESIGEWRDSLFGKKSKEDDDNSKSSEEAAGIAKNMADATAGGHGAEYANILAATGEVTASELKEIIDQAEAAAESLDELNTGDISTEPFSEVADALGQAAEAAEELSTAELYPDWNEEQKDALEDFRTAMTQFSDAGLINSESDGREMAEKYLSTFCGGVYEGDETMISAFEQVFDKIVGKSEESAEEVADQVGEAVDAVEELSSVDADFSKLKSAANALDSVSDSATGLKDALGEGGSAVSGTAKGIGKGLEKTMKSTVNSFASGINSGTSKVNTWMTKLQGLPVVGSFLSGLTRLPSIPKLAQGGVIPANREFLAVLGDQKQGTNIEAPLDTIVSAVMAAMNAQGLNAGAIGSAVKQGLSGLSLKVGKREFGEIAADAINMNRQAAGKLALNL